MTREKFLRILMYGGVDKETYTSLHGLISYRNRKSMLAFTSVAALAMLAMLLSSCLEPSLEKFRCIYVICIFVFVIIGMAMLKSGGRNDILLYSGMYTFMGMLMAFGILQGTYMDPNEVSVSFPILIFVVPLLLTDIPIRMNSAIMVSIIAYCIAAGQTQSSTIFGYNMTNVIPYGILSICVSTYMMTLKVNRYHLAIQNQQANMELEKKVDENEELIERLEESNDSLTEQIWTIEGLSKHFFAAYRGDLINGTFTVVKERDFVRAILGDTDSIPVAFDLFIKTGVVADYQNSMRVFCDHTSVSDRLADKDSVSIEYMSIYGEPCWNRACWISLDRDTDGRVTQAMYVVEDVSYEVEERLKYENQLGIVERDSLTGLYTRSAFFFHAKETLDANPEIVYDLIIFDIANIKYINSTYSEKMGDEILKLMGGFLIQNITPGSIYARLKTTCFVALTPAVHKDYYKWLEEKARIFNTKTPISNVVINSGIYENVDRSIMVEEMCERAELALNSIRDDYNKSIAFFDEPVIQRQIRASQYENRFKEALEANEFKVWYQPKFDPFTEKIKGAEALVRWMIDGKPIQPHMEFLGVFEANGQIVQLDEYIFRNVCIQQNKWRSMGRELFPISVNLSRKTMFRNDLVKTYREIADEYSLDPYYVPIEITESAAVTSEQIKPLADAFCAAGFSIHMDDFGAGQSSLSSLSLMNCEVVKLDKSLIDTIGDDRGDIIIQYIMNLTRELGMSVVAEGVETQAQLAFLKKHSCDAIQGFYFSKPLPCEDFEKMLQDKL